MRVRVGASLLLALAGAVVLAVSMHARAAEHRHQALQSAAVAGSTTASPRTSGDAYLAALVAFRTGRKQTTAAQRAATIASVHQTIRTALAAEQPAAHRSQLENLAGVLELELARLGGAQAGAHTRVAAHWLQRAVLDDDANADAKFNLELLMSRHPQAARKQPRPDQSANKSKVPSGTRKGKNQKNKSPKPGTLGDGF